MMQNKALLEVMDLSVTFCMYEKGLRQKKINAISNLCIKAAKGEILAVAGASGSGKSILAHAIMGLLPSNAEIKGTIQYQGEDLTQKRLKTLRGRKIVLLPQGVSCLNPMIPIGRQMRKADSGKEGQILQRNAFKRFGLNEKTEALYPFQLSGGMARRALLATIGQENPELIIADEPTPGLDLKMAEYAFDYFRECADKGAGVIIITHDIDTAVRYADKIAIFFSGTTLETAPSSDFSKGEEAFRHPYTKALFASLPQNGFVATKEILPHKEQSVEGCIYAPLCSWVKEDCHQKIPMRKLRGGEVRCIYAT